MIHFFGGQGIGWALDEDLNRARQALVGQIHEGSFACSPLIHSAWWPPLLQVGAASLKGKSVLCFADNPPAFYLTRPGFEQAAARVDLWIARSQEAVRQFRELGLPVALVPYTIDPQVFYPLAEEERRRIRADLGLMEGDFVVGNFHRDSLERDLSLPKVQKGPDLFIDLVEKARESIPSLKVLLAGPRRHWLRGELTRRGIPFVFVGTLLESDDFLVNVLPREHLNRLYAALDCVLISSRWEGGPYAALESIFAGRPVISTRVGMSADLLGEYLYDTPSEGVDLLAQIEREGVNVSSLRQAALVSHSSEALASALLNAYAGISRKGSSLPEAAKTFFSLGLSRVHQTFRKSLGRHEGVSAVMEAVRRKNSGNSPITKEAVSIAEAEAAIQSS